MLNIKDYTISQFKELSDVFNTVQTLTPKMEEIVKVCVNSIKDGNKIIFCGNGCSAGQSQDFCTKLIVKCKIERDPINVIALTTNSSNLTAIGNDFGFESIFSRQLQGIGAKGDVIIGLSTSGNSKNVLTAFGVAKEKGITTIALVGKDGGEMSKISDYSLIVPSKSSSHIQVCHLAIGQILCDLIEDGLYGVK